MPGRGSTRCWTRFHLPEGWTSEPARLQGVSLAPDTPFRTKPQLAQRRLARAQATGVSLAWVVGDTVHGHSGQLRAWLEDRDQAYLLFRRAWTSTRCATPGAGTAT
ncbi:MAG: transposase [Caldilineaceae bacterium]|nr:transposase [Caldilineaceae bacterium]